jgi:hypothetical protein
MVAELSPEQGQSLIDQVEPQPAASPEEAITALQSMMGNPEDMEAEAAQRGYEAGAAPSKERGMPMKRVFGEDM